MSAQSFGRIDYDPVGRAWIVQCQPFVSLRLKRVFAKIRHGSQGSHIVSDTIENARELRWFLQRYPMECREIDRLTRNALKHKQMMEETYSIVSGDYKPPDFELALPAREYQKLPAAMLLARGGLLLADHIGLGKTVSAIYSLQDPRTLPALVVVPVHLAIQWKAELARFAPKLKVHIVKRGTPYNVRFQSGAMPDVIVISYSKLVKWGELLVSPAVGCRSVYYDDVQDLRRSESDKYEAAEFISRKVQYRCGMSQTPFYNYGGEMFNVLQCLFPDELGTRQEFGSEWCGGSTGDKAEIEDPQAFGSYLREQGLMIRRTRSDVGRELAAAQIIPQTVECDSPTLNRITGACAELARLILRDTKEEWRGEKMRAGGELDKIVRQATGIAKAPFIAEFVRMLFESGEKKIVVFLWHRAVYAIMMDRLKEFRPVLFTGSESPAQKEAAKKAFVEGDSQLLLVSLRSGSGLDGLQYVCNTVVIGELDWSPGVLSQCIGRVLRDGQTDPVLVYYLLAEEGCDPVMSQVLGIKRQQLDGVILNREEQAGHGEAFEKLQRDESHIKKLAQAYLEKATRRSEEESREAADDALSLAVN